MTHTLNGDFLPLGTIVRLQDVENEAILYVVVARAIAKGPQDTVVPRYRVAPHPYGDVPSQEVFSIQHTQIEEVIFKGYEDEQDTVFLEDLFSMMEKAEQGGGITPTPPSAPSEGSVEPIIEKGPSASERLQEDPFYKFRTKGE